MYYGRLTLYYGRLTLYCLFETAEDTSTRRIADNGRQMCGAEDIVKMVLTFLTKPGYPPGTTNVGAHIPPDAAAASSVEECFAKLWKTRNYNIINYVSEFEEGVMEHYYEKQFDKKDASIIIPARTEDENADKLKLNN